MNSNKGYYITKDGKRGDIFFHDDNFESEIYRASKRYIPLGEYETFQYRLVIRETNIIELVVPNGYNYVDCCFNCIEKLTIPLGVRTLFCSFNLIKELSLPASVKNLYCRGKSIRKLILTPDSKLDKVICNIEAPINPLEYPSVRRFDLY